MSSSSTPSSKPLVIITGASSGIGAAAAKAFSADGHPLLLLARRLDRLTSLNLPNTLCEKVDITDYSAVQSAVEKAEKLYGPCDLLVNNSGLMQLGKIDTQSITEWDAMIDVNIKGLMYCVKAVLPGMKARKGGVIINISSIAGIKTFPNHAVYCGTKFGVHGFTETLREEVSQDGIKVCLVSPGAVETELLSHTTDASIKGGYENWKKDMVKILEADDVVNAIQFVYKQPKHCCIREVVLAATKQEK